MADTPNLPSASNGAVKQNPASAPLTRVTEATRVPMGLPRRKLEVPDLPGFYLYWFKSDNVRAALRAGYVFVDQDEVDINNFNVADSTDTSGSSDMGSRISIPSGTLMAADGTAERLYLMKLPMEWHLKDMKARDAQNDLVAAQLRSGIIGAEKDPDRAKRYLKAGQDMFIPKPRRGD